MRCGHDRPFRSCQLPGANGEAVLEAAQALKSKIEQVENAIRKAMVAREVEDAVKDGVDEAFQRAKED